MGVLTSEENVDMLTRGRQRLLNFYGHTFLDFFTLYGNANVLALFCFFVGFLQENIQTSLENHILIINKVCLFMSYDTMDYISFVIWYWEGNNGVVKCKN